VVDFPDDDRMRISHETIYQALYVQGRGALRRELTVCLRTGRARRKPQNRANARRERIKDKVMISERPAEVADLAGIGRATLYRRPELRAVVEEHRQQSREALTLTGLAIQLDQLRTGLEAVAAKVRRQKEELRRLRRPSRTSQN